MILTALTYAAYTFGGFSFLYGVKKGYNYFSSSNDCNNKKDKIEKKIEDAFDWMHLVPGYEIEQYYNQKQLEENIKNSKDIFDLIAAEYKALARQEEINKDYSLKLK